MILMILIPLYFGIGVFLLAVFDKDGVTGDWYDGCSNLLDLLIFWLVLPYFVYHTYLRNKGK